VRKNQASVKFKRVIQVSELHISLLLLIQIVIKMYLHKETSFIVFEMAQNLELLELLNTLINTTEDNTVILKKTTLQLVLTCFHVTQDKFRPLQSLSQLLNDGLTNLKNQQPVKCSELVFVQHNSLYDDDDDDVFDQQSVKEKVNKTIVDADKDENIHEPTFQEFSFDFSKENLSILQQHAVNTLPRISKQKV
jgi:hypothetical protein